MTVRPPVADVVALTKRLLTALDDLLLRGYVGALYRDLPDSVHEIRYWGTAVGSPKATCDGEPCYDDLVLRMDWRLGRSLGELVFRREEYPWLEPTAARLQLHRVLLEAIAQYVRWVPAKQRLLVWWPVAELVTNAHCYTETASWAARVHNACDIVGTFAIATCLGVVGPPPWRYWHKCFEVCCDGTLCNPAHDTSPYAQALRKVVGIRDLHWFLCATTRWTRSGCPVFEFDFHYARSYADPLEVVSGLLRLLGRVLAPLGPTDRARCIEEVCALLTACPVAAGLR